MCESHPAERRESAVHGDHRAGHEPGAGRQQPEERAQQVLGVAEAPQQDAL